MPSSLRMSREEREAFLADVHIGVLAISNPAGAPVVTPIWYHYEPGGDVHIVIGKDGMKGRALVNGQRVSLCVQTETPPYKYVTVEGPILRGPVDFQRDLKDVAIRYLGERMGTAYVAGSNEKTDDNVLIRLTPDTWRTVDYGKRG